MTFAWASADSITALNWVSVDCPGACVSARVWLCLWGWGQCAVQRGHVGRPTALGPVCFQMSFPIKSNIYNWLPLTAFWATV